MSMYTTDLLSQNTMLHRGVVTYSSATTGEIRVKVPSILGTSEEMSISYIGRTKSNSGSWVVPSVGDQILVTSDDVNFTNLFWIPIGMPAGSSQTTSQDTSRDTLIKIYMEVN